MSYLFFSCTIKEILNSDMYQMIFFSTAVIKLVCEYAAVECIYILENSFKVIKKNDKFEIHAIGYLLKFVKLLLDVTRIYCKIF